MHLGDIVELVEEVAVAHRNGPRVYPKGSQLAYVGPWYESGISELFDRTDRTTLRVPDSSFRKV